MISKFNFSTLKVSPSLGGASALAPRWGRFLEKLDPCDLPTIMMINDHYDDDIDDDQGDQYKKNGLPGSLLSLPTAR